MVHVVLRLDSHECDLIDVGARDKTARLASSEACDMWAVRPCFAAIEVCFIPDQPPDTCACVFIDTL